MQCPNCGAALSPALSTDYYFCAYCGAFHFPKPTDEGVVMLPGDGVAWEHESTCPVCGDPLQNARVDAADARYCLRCRGVLVARAGFVAAVRRLAELRQPPPFDPRPTNLDALHRLLRCPLCHHAMDVHPYYGPANIIIDTCGRCQVIWLDHGELSRIIAGFAAEDRA